MGNAIQMSKLHCALTDKSETPLTVKEAFYLGTLGGGSFFGKVGSFETGYEFDSLVIDDESLPSPFPLTIEERLARVLYLSDDRHIHKKYVRGRSILGGAVR
jgi:guanine deaminase